VCLALPWAQGGGLAYEQLVLPTKRRTRGLKRPPQAPHSVGGVLDPSCRDAEGGLGHGQARRILDPSDALVAAPLAEVDARVDQVRENVAPDGLLGVVGDDRALRDIKQRLWLC